MVLFLKDKDLTQEDEGVLIPCITSLSNASANIHDSTLFTESGINSLNDVCAGGN